MANADEQYHQRSTEEAPTSTKTTQNQQKNHTQPSQTPKVGISDDDLKNRVSLRVSAPGYTYPWYRWVIPMLGETTAGIGAIGIPVVVGTFINHQIAGHTVDAWLLFWVVVVSIGFIALNEYFGWGASMKFGAELDRDWRTYINALLNRAAHKNNAGEMVTVMSKDVRRISAVFFSIPLFTNAMIIATLGAIQLWLISPLTAAVTLTGTALVIWVLAKYSTFMESKVGVYRAKDGENSSRASDIATGLRTITGLGAEQQMRERYHQGADDVFDALMEYEKTHRWMFLIRVFLSGTVTLLGIGFALTGHVENGRWVPDVPAASLVTVASIIAMMGGPVWISQNFLTEWRYAKVGLAKVARLEGYAGVRQGVLKEPRTDTELEAYMSHEKEHDMPVVNIPQVPAKARNARIVYINPRHWQLTAQEYAESLVEHLRALAAEKLPDKQRILLSEPNPMIFAGTLRNHLRLGTVPPEDTVAAQAKDEALLQITDSSEIAYRLGGRNPDEYFEALITSEGANLSGGQRQRLALARALAQDTQILILTEPLNSVDEPSQKYIYDRLEECVGIPTAPELYPGLLAGFETIYIISTTAEVSRRIARDNNIETQRVNHV